MRRRKQRDSDGRKVIQFLLGSRIPMAALIQTLAVAEYLSFHRAGQALRTSQSSVSIQIKELENDIGVILFDRNTRVVNSQSAPSLIAAPIIFVFRNNHSWQNKIKSISFTSNLGRSLIAGSN